MSKQLTLEEKIDKLLSQQSMLLNDNRKIKEVLFPKKGATPPEARSKRKETIRQKYFPHLPPQN